MQQPRKVRVGVYLYKRDSDCFTQSRLTSTVQAGLNHLHPTVTESELASEMAQDLQRRT